ncbi:hypothetical protein D5018_03825 [Parashewanella curva]|uniref:DUF2116 family Zn-ribbon domain-containing protein n=1 Tax=Parashewanella curva TaxID=2338552 RepID=A0A3L8Q0L8_9GAMM|nr:hypothetical protein [Parashewanella curva]RLV60980.1 hypothetical protein D5018_03825 [Parashewanella curva]
MADQVDDANAINEVMLNAQLSNRTTELLPATGKCLNCFEPIEGDLRFCDADCRDDHKKREFMKHGR